MFCGSLSNACDLREEENYLPRCSEMLFSLETGYLLFGEKKKKKPSYLFSCLFCILAEKLHTKIFLLKYC